MPVGSVGDELAQGMDSILHAFGDRFRLIVVDVRAGPGHGVDFAARACEYVIQVTEA